MIYKGKIIEKGVVCRVQDSNEAFSIINKYKDEFMEINIYEMKKGHSFFFRPPLVDKSIKTYYLLEGQLFNYDTQRDYSTGDMVVLDFQSEPFNFDVKETTKVLVHSTHDNSFETTTNLFKNVNETIEKIEEKDSYTKGHSNRVYELVKLMVAELQYVGNKRKNILHAARYHDVGKIYIEDSILNKPSILNQAEFEIMKSHAILGKEIIESCFDEKTYKIISQHHERIDGSGYPFGLRGEEIIEEAKIIAICDSFDAMTTDRVYKKGKTVDEAIVELKGLSGIKYDAQFVDLFIDKVLPKHFK